MASRKVLAAPGLGALLVAGVQRHAKGLAAHSGVCENVVADIPVVTSVPSRCIGGTENEFPGATGCVCGGGGVRKGMLSTHSAS
jgi:hypothetical protein